MGTAADTIRQAWDRMQAVFEKKPALGRGSHVMRARVLEGLQCALQEGDWQFSADMAVEAGGSGQHPTPGVYGRAALASCLAIGYTAWLARAGLSWRSLEVEVQVDYDAGGMVGVPGVNPAYAQIRHTLYIDSDAPQAALRQAIDRAQTCSPYLHIFAEPQPVSGRVVFGPREA
jgi:uncharacterized OsmC-like protein